MLMMKIDIVCALKMDMREMRIFQLRAVISRNILSYFCNSEMLTSVNCSNFNYMCQS